MINRSITPEADKHQPIGIFDSGVGGLTVLEAMVQLLPNEHYVYFGDSGNCPYGGRTKEEITQSSKTIVEFLLAQNCKLIIVACNTITTNIIEELRASYPVPFIGMEPATKPASLQTKNKRIGILATQGTLNGDLFDKTLKKYAEGIEVFTQVGHGLVELIEQNQIDTPVMESQLHSLLDPMIDAGIDTLVLGCTHYHFLKNVLKKILPTSVAIIDTSVSVAKHARNVLLKMNLLQTSTTPSLQITTSGTIDSIAPLLNQLSFGKYIPLVHQY